MVTGGVLRWTVYATVCAALIYGTGRAEDEADISIGPRTEAAADGWVAVAVGGGAADQAGARPAAPTTTAPPTPTSPPIRATFRATIQPLP